MGRSAIAFASVSSHSHHLNGVIAEECDNELSLGIQHPEQPAHAEDIVCVTWEGINDGSARLRRDLRPLQSNKTRLRTGSCHARASRSRTSINGHRSRYSIRCRQAMGQVMTTAHARISSSSGQQRRSVSSNKSEQRSTVAPGG
jgi:hypothetical protein